MKAKKWIVMGLVVAGVGAFSTVSEARQAPKGSYSVVDVAKNLNRVTGEYSIWIAALSATGLDSILQGKGQFTVFAPINEAFGGLDREDMAAMSEAELTVLADVLLNHMTHGHRLSGSLAKAGKVRTLGSGSLAITVNHNGMFVNDAKVLAADRQADNGVMYVIDHLLIP